MLGVAGYRLAARSLGLRARLAAVRARTALARACAGGAGARKVAVFLAAVFLAAFAGALGFGVSGTARPAARRPPSSTWNAGRNGSPRWLRSASACDSRTDRARGV